MNDVITEFSSILNGILASLKQELQSVRTNRPQAGLIENVSVLYYGQATPLKSLCSVAVVPPRELQCSVFDKSVVSAVVKALEETGAGFSLAQDGNIVRVFLPELTSERKEEVVRYLRKIAEEKRIEARRIRDERNKDVNERAAKSELREDDKFKIRESIQKEMDRMNEEIEKVVSMKEKEIRS